MSKNDNLGDRMKNNYESSYNVKLPMRLPVIIRLDGRSFHTYTKGLKKEKGRPCDPNLEEVMNLTAKKLCEEIQGAQMAYVQSDEISVLVHNYKKITSESWFGNEIQKMVSISAAMASVEFTMNSPKIWGEVKPAVFDSRVFVLPEFEVVNSFIWRQQDCTRNSVQMLARSLFSHRECSFKNSAQLMDMCLILAGRNWNDEPTSFKRGRCIVQERRQIEGGNVRKSWVVDNEIPIFSKDREYVQKFLAVEVEKKEEM
jgi:tRNA(His) 5'-end guanylyltransferase